MSIAYRRGADGRGPLHPYSTLAEAHDMHYHPGQTWRSAPKPGELEYLKCRTWNSKPKKNAPPREVYPSGASS